MARFMRLAEEVFADRGGVPAQPPPSKPPEALVAVSCAAAALFLAVSWTRRGRVWMRMRPRLRQPSAHGGVYLEAFAVGITIGVIGVVMAELLYWTPLLYLHNVALLVAIIYAFARAQSIRVPLAEWGWRPGRGLDREIAIGVLTGLVLAFLRYLPRTVLWPDSAASDLSRSTWAFERTIIWAPIIEETVFRGMLYRSLRDRWRWPVAVVVCAVVFAAVHQPASRWPYVFVAGVVYALLREWRGSLLAPVAAHATFNLIVTLAR